MLKNILFLAITLLTLQIYSQKEICNSPDDDNLLLDLNSITKCSIKDSKIDSNGKTKSKSVQVVVASSRRRIIRKRNTASSLKNLNYTNKIKELNNTNSIVKSLNLTNHKIIPLGYVDQVPLFKKCESSPLNQQKECFKKELSNHIRKNFKYPESAYDRAIQGKVFVYFTVKEDGGLGQMKISPPYKGEELANEVKRIIKKLPNLKPGKHNGTNVTVKYGFPIIFKIPGVKASNIKKAAKKINLKEVYTFNQIETIPQFNSCKKTNDTSLKCYNTNLVKHIQENFAYPKTAVNKGIKGIVDIQFIINKKGEIVNIETKGPENGAILEKAAKVLIQKLPKFKAGIKQGKTVNVKYSFPITFKLD